MTPKIAILETIHDHGIETLKRFSEVDHLEGLDRNDLLKIIKNYDGAIIKSNIKIDAEFLNCAKNLNFVARGGVGTDNIDLALLKKHKIQLFLTPTANTISTAEFTIGTIIALAKRFPELSCAVNKKDFRRHLYEGRELAQMNVGILGLGNVGMAVAKRLSSFGCKLYGCDRTMRRETIFNDLGGEMVEKLEDMLPFLDVLSIHVPLTGQTKNLINSKILQKIKPGCILINTSRGSVVNQFDLLEALNDGKLSTAALDVLDPEPPYNCPPEKCDYSHVLLNHPKIMYTPHVAASTREAQKEISMSLALKIEEFYKNKRR